MSKLKSFRASKTSVVASVLTCLALAATAGSGAAAVITREDTEDRGTEIRETADIASRSWQRVPEPTESTKAMTEEVTVTSPPVTAQVPVPAVTTAPIPPAKPKGPPKPVAGLTQIQMNNAAHIVAAGKALGLPKRAFVLAIACALQESNLYNLASTALPESFNYPNEGSGSDHDSVGLFQQRPSSGWGTVRNLMKPDYAAKAFYRALILIPGWSTMSLTLAIQAVQISAYPYAYAPHESRAITIVNALT